MIYKDFLLRQAQRMPPPESPQHPESRQHNPAYKALTDEGKRQELTGPGSSSPGVSLEESSGLTSSAKTSLPVNKEVLKYVSSTTTHPFSYEFRLYDHDGGTLQTVPPVSKLKGTLVDSTEDRRSNCTALETLNEPVEFTKPSKTMLSSAMVSVLSPHWSRRNQRTKKGMSTEDFEAQNVAHGPHTGAQAVHNRFLEPHRQYRGERALGDAPHVQERDPLVGPRRRTEGWSSMSGPSSINLNSTTKRLTPLTVSFGVDSCSLDNRDTSGCRNNPKEKTPPPIPSLSIDLCTNERMSSTGHEGQLAQPSSKPTTSSLLLSLRKIGSNWRSPATSETGCRSLTGPIRDRVAVPSNPCPSPTSPNNNSSERWTPRPYASHIPYGHLKNNQNISQTNSVTNLTLSHPQKQIPTNQPGRQENPSISDNNTDPTRLSQLEQYTILKNQALPRGTTLRSETWWRQVTQEGSSQPSLKDTANIINNNRNETDTPLVKPCNSNSDSASLTPNDNRSLNRQIYSHANYYTESESDTFPTHSKGPNLNEKQSQRLNSSPREVNRVNVSNASFKDNVTKLPVTSFPTKSSKTVSANIINQNVYSLDKSHLTANTQTALLAPSPISNPTNMDCRFSEITSPKTQNENKSIYTFKKQSHSLDVNDTLTCRTQQPASSQDTSSQSTVLPRCAYNKPKPLAFERTYPSITTLVHPKTLCMYQSTVSSKTNCSPLLMSRTSPSTPYTTPVSTTTTPTSVHLIAPVTAATTTSPTPLISTSFLLTPPVTPPPARLPSPKSSLSKSEGTFSGSLDTSSSKKQSPTSEGKTRRRVTWEDSVDLQQSEDDKGQTSVPTTPSALQKTSPLSLSRSPRTLESPSIFSFLREGSPTEVRQSSTICLPIPKTTSIQAQSGEKGKQTVSANPVSPMEWTSDHRGMLPTSPGPDKRLSDRASQWLSTPPSLPSDFGYQQRYSSPPYSTLKSTRSPQGDAKNSLPTSPPGFHQQTFSPSFISRPSSLCLDPVANRTLPQSQYSPALIPPTQIVPLPFPNRSVLPEGLKCDVFRLKEADNNSGKQNQHSNKNTSMSQVDNKAVIGSEPLSLQATLQEKTLQEKTLTTSSVCLNVIETLVYSISKGNSTALPDNTTPKSLLQCTSNTKVSVETKPITQLSTKNSGVGSNQYCALNPNANTSNTKETQLPLFRATDDGNESSKSRSWTNERTSTPCASLPANQETHVVPDKATLESAHKGINKVDHVLNKLRQTFSGRRSSDDLTCSLKCNQSSKTPSITGSSDSNSSDSTVTSNDTLDGDKQGERMEILGDTNGQLERREMEKERRKQNRSLITPQVLGNRRGDHFSSCSDIIPGAQNKFSLSSQPFMEREAQAEQMRQHFKESDRVDVKTSQPQCGEHSPRRQSPGDPHCSTNRPHSPFSPLSSTAPLSPFLTATEIEDSVFYSPKELTEMGKSASPLGTTRQQMSTGPSTGGPSWRPEKERLASYSSCADLKYGIDAGRCISVSSVVSSRRLGSERISTGSRVLSADDLCDCAHETSKYKCQGTGDQGNANRYQLSSGPSEMRSRSLPRSLTRSLSCWSSEDGLSPTATPHDRLSGPRSRDTDPFRYYSEGVPTPPPSPPSPAARLMSKPPGCSSPRSPGVPKDSQSVRGTLPTRGLVANLSDFDESSSDSSSDSTTDDEYYLDSEEDDDKESEL